MCGRFYIADDDETSEIARMIEDAAIRQEQIIGTRAIAFGQVRPADTVAALTRLKNGRVGAFPMRWGFQLDKSRLLINARSETAAQKPLFSPSLEQRRCLIPLSFYYEWAQQEAQVSLLPDIHAKPIKVKYKIRTADCVQIYLSALYRYEAHSPLPAFTVLTRAASPDIAFIHDRMPVLFDEKMGMAWLSESANPDMLFDHALSRMTYEMA